MTINAAFVHTNIISSDWKKLSEFYINVFQCKPVIPERHLEGDWIDVGQKKQLLKARGEL